MEEQELVKIARALADPTRLGILRAIWARGEVCCGDIWRSVPVSAATVTHHLRVLSGARLVESRREGQFIRVRPIKGTLEEYCRAVTDVFACPAGSDRSGGRPS
jgi:ArsR family transcriptional regulator, arsenate/arsenite/antimonite-responsive transcriptional repressor